MIRRIRLLSRQPGRSFDDYPAELAADAAASLSSFMYCGAAEKLPISKPLMLDSFRCVSPSSDTHMCVYCSSVTPTDGFDRRPTSIIAVQRIVGNLEGKRSLYLEFDLTTLVLGKIKIFLNFT